jgi:ketosteroid isomerase-like protein
MSNLDLVRSLYVDWGRGDYGSVAWADPAIEFAIVDGPSPGTWKGVEEMVRGYREVMTAWEDYSAEAEEYRELDEERVLVLIHLRGRGKASGMEIGQIYPNAAGVFHVRDGKVTRIALYWDRERALADVGLAQSAERGEPG